MLDILYSEKEDFNFVVNNALLEVTPIRLRVSIADKLLAYYNDLRAKLAEYKSELAEMVRENEFLKDRLANKYSELDDFDESELGEQEEAL